MKQSHSELELAPKQIATLAPPPAPGAPDLIDASDSGSNNKDNLTNIVMPTFSGTVAPNLTVLLFSDGTLVGSGVASSTGVWQIKANQALAEGVRNITVAAVNSAGELSPYSSPLQVTIDTAPLAAPGAPDLISSSDSGNSNSDNITNINAPSFGGTAVAGAKVHLYANGVEVANGVASSSGLWALTSGTLSHGNHVMTAKIEDAAGNLSSASSALNLTVDTFAATPATPDLVASSDSGDSSSDNLTNKQTPTFRGTAEAGATVTLYDGSTLIGTGIANGSGVWSIVSSTLASGVHNISVGQRDVAGNTSARSTTLAVTIDTTAPIAPSQPDLLASYDTGVSNSDNITKASTLGFAGSAEAGRNIRLVEGSTVLATGKVDGAGLWTLITPTLTNGNHAISTQISDIAGNWSASSTALNVQVDTVAPTATITPGKTQVLPGSAFGYTVNFTETVVSGTVSADDFSIINGTINTITGSGSSYAVNVTAASTVGLNVDFGLKANTNITDLAGNIALSGNAAPVKIGAANTLPVIDYYEYFREFIDTCPTCLTADPSLLGSRTYISAGFHDLESKPSQLTYSSNWSTYAQKTYPSGDIVGGRVDLSHSAGGTFIPGTLTVSDPSGGTTSAAPVQTFAFSLTGSRAELSAFGTNQTIDANRDGIRDHTGWVAGDTGMLVAQGTHGDFAIVTLPQLQQSYDANHDGQLNRDDQSWHKLAYWQDQNHNGQIDNGETMQLNALRVANIELEGTGGHSQSGNLILGQYRVSFADGHTTEAADVLLSFINGALGEGQVAAIVGQQQVHLHG